MSKLQRIDLDLVAGIAAFLLLIVGQAIGGLTDEVSAVLLTFAIAAIGRFAVRRRKAAKAEAAADEVKKSEEEAAKEGGDDVEAE